VVTAGMSLVRFVIVPVPFGVVILAVVRFVVSRLCLHEQITTMLGKPRCSGRQVGCDGEADPDERTDGSRRADTASRVVVRRKVMHGQTGKVRGKRAEARRKGSASEGKNVCQTAD
jgi:hypothetical protein